MKLKIAGALHKALLEEGKMEYALYEFDMEEHVEGWTKNTKENGIDFFFAITENTGDVAMVLITSKGKLYINEKARDKLKKMWTANYENNIKMFLPAMVADLADGFFVQIDVKIDTSANISKT